MIMINLKYLVTIITFLISFSVPGQEEKDSLVIGFIKAKSEYIGLNELHKIPATIKPYIDLVKDYMIQNKMNPDDYWIWTSYIRENSNSIWIPICHYDGFVFEKRLESENKEANKYRNEEAPIVVMDYNGNASGKDGNIEIDKKTETVLSFKLWQ